MDALSRTFGDWEVVVLPKDGARIARLAFRGQELLTDAPRGFRAPSRDYGKYETRPVYGYDDCFPTVDACPYPGGTWEVPDHGELCWLPWDVRWGGSSLVCTARSRAMPVLFTRTLEFSADAIDWMFEVENQGAEEAVFQHVMHPLMPPGSIQNIDLPEFHAVLGDDAAPVTGLERPADVRASLLGQPDGTARMLFLQRVSAGLVQLRFESGLGLSVEFRHELFPTLGIWWNNGGYPDEDGIRRRECAFEPISGRTSQLASAHAEGEALSAAPGDSTRWSVRWAVSPA